MSSGSQDDRVDALLSGAEKAHRQGNAAQALLQLKEAAHLDSQNEKVRQALQSLQLSSQGDIPTRLRQYAASGVTADYEALLKSIAEAQQLDGVTSVQALDIILSQDLTHGPWAEILTTLLARQDALKQVIARRWEEDGENFIELMLKADDRVSAMLHLIILTATNWPTPEALDSVQQDVFVKLAGRWLNAGSPGRVRIGTILARQLRSRPDHVSLTADESVYKAMFLLAGPGMTPQEGASGYAGITQLFKYAPDRSEAAFTKLITAYVTSVQSNELAIALSVASRMFLTLASICTKLFLTEGFLEQLTTLLEVPKVVEVEDTQRAQLQNLTLDLLNAACVDRLCREAIQQKASAQLEALSRSSDESLSAQATLILVKLAGIMVDKATVARLIHMAIQGESPSSHAIEGLAYVSLSPAAKERIIVQQALLSRLIVALRSRQHVYSCLTIIHNLTAYRPPQSEEQKKMAQLKAYVNQTKTKAEDPLDNNAMVTIRCNKLLEAGVVSALAHLGGTGSAEDRRLTTLILNALAREAKHRTKMVQEGAVKLLLKIDELSVRTDRPDSAAAQRTGAHALAKILISVNPEHVFSAAVPASSAVGAILPLLEIDQSQDERDLLPTFEALLALTNLASMGDQSICDLIIRKAWTSLEDQHLLSSNRLIQRASVELVCNLMLTPTGVAKFADGSDQAARRLHILLALADVDDLATRRAAGGALAMLTEWDTAVKAVLKIERGVAILLSMATDASEEIQHRGVVCLVNCCGMPKLEAEAIAKLRSLDAADAIKQSSTTQSPDLQAATSDLLKLLT